MRRKHRGSLEEEDVVEEEGEARVQDSSLIILIGDTEEMFSAIIATSLGTLKLNTGTKMRLLTAMKAS